MANNTVVSFTIRCVDRATKVITSIGGAIGKLANGIFGMGADLGGWVQSLQSAAASAQGVFSRLWGAIRESFKFESLTTQFKTLLGSAESARRASYSRAKRARRRSFTSGCRGAAARTSRRR